MTRKSQILLVTHVLALTLGYGLVRKSAEFAAAGKEGPPEYTKLADRESLAAGDGDELLVDFLDERSGKHSRYSELKATLPVANDLRGAVVSAIQGLGGADWRDGLTVDEQAVRLAEVEVRVFHWMKENPVEAMSFVLNDSASEELGLPALLNKQVFQEIAAQNGVLKSVRWLIRSEVTFGTLCTVALNEIRVGGGFGLFEKLDAAISRSSNRSEFRAFCAQPLVSDNPDYDGEYFLRLVGGATRIEERENLMEKVRRLRGNRDKVELLSGFAASGGEAAGWLLGVIQRGELKGIVPVEMLAELNKVVVEVATLDWEQRLEILRTDPEFEVKSRQELVDARVAADVRRLLENGRDWRYEFRTGVASADDALAAVRAGLPRIPATGEEMMRASLYRQLAEEDPKKALSLLEPFPPEKRRAVLFDSAWLGFGNVSPDDFLRFLADVPDAKTPEEQELKLKGWNTKVRANLWRYGDDYVEWVKHLPAGIHQEAAMNSILWATSEQNPAQARALSEQFYPRKP